MRVYISTVREAEHVMNADRIGRIARTVRRGEIVVVWSNGVCLSPRVCAGAARGLSCGGRVMSAAFLAEQIRGCEDSPKIREPSDPKSRTPPLCARSCDGLGG